MESASAFAGFTNTVALTNGANLFSGTFFNGTFSGNGTNLVNLNASQLTGGTVADAKPAYEYEESVAKASAVMRAVELACEQPDWA